MRFKQTILWGLLPAVLALPMSAYAEDEGISFMYGVGIMGFSSTTKNPDLNASGSGELFVGIEERGWSFEHSMARTVKTGTSFTNQDYVANISTTSLAYRTVENDSGMYYKIRYGKSNVDFDFSGASTSTVKTDGSSYGLGVGWRTDRTERFEVEGGLYTSDAVDNTYFLTLRYIWGGTPKVDEFRRSR